MQLIAYYQYVPADYDEKGNHKHNCKLFLEQIDEWDKEFHQEYAPYYANHLFANYATMRLIDSSMDLEEEASSGMDLIDGVIDIDVNTEMEKYSEKYTIYALGSKLEGNPDEPIFLIRDESMGDGHVMLKYMILCNALDLVHSEWRFEHDSK